MGYVIMTTTKSVQEWIDQAKESVRVMQAAGYKDLNEFADKDKKYCTLLLQAFDALGQTIDPELEKRCGIKRVLDEHELD